MLYNNGYIIKDLIANKEFPIKYRGLQSCHNWPLSKKHDRRSMEINNLLLNHFENNYYVEIIKDSNILKQYINHCKILNIDITILKIMTCNDTSIVDDEDIKEEEFLGYDCIAGDSISYLAEIYMDGADEIGLYRNIKSKVNENGLNDYLEYATEKARVDELKMQNSYFINSLYKR